MERQVVLMHYAVFLEDWGSAIDQSAKWTRQSKERAHLCVSISYNLQAEAIIVTVLSDVLVADGPNTSRVEKCFGMVNSEIKSISKSRRSCSRFDTTLKRFKVINQNGLWLYSCRVQYILCICTRTILQSSYNYLFVWVLVWVHCMFKLSKCIFFFFYLLATSCCQVAVRVEVHGSKKWPRFIFQLPREECCGETLTQTSV